MNILKKDTCNSIVRFEFEINHIHLQCFYILIYLTLNINQDTDQHPTDRAFKYFHNEQIGLQLNRGTSVWDSQLIKSFCFVPSDPFHWHSMVLPQQLPLFWRLWHHSVNHSLRRQSFCTRQNRLTSLSFSAHPPRMCSLHLVLQCLVRYDTTPAQEEK